MKIVVINGYPQAGKDTFVDMLRKGDTYSIRQIHASTPAKMALKNLGWDGITKTPDIRDTLAELKTLSEIRFDGTMNYIKSEVSSFDNCRGKLLFIHAREPELIERIRYTLNATTLLIQRDSAMVYQTNSSDANVENYCYDYTIHNNGTLERLELVAHIWLKEVLK